MLQGWVVCHLIAIFNQFFSDVLPIQGFNASTFSCGSSLLNRIQARGNHITTEMKGLSAPFSTSNIVLSGESLTCDPHFISAAIELQSTACTAYYKECDVDEVNANCRVKCRFETRQLGQPFIIKLWIIGDGNTKLCNVETDHLHTKLTDGEGE